MRPIKFRAWDTNHSVMLAPATVCGDHPDNHLWVDDNIVRKFFPEDREPYEPAESGFWVLGDFKIMQFTGLKDKNGTEIYLD